MFRALLIVVLFHLENDHSGDHDGKLQKNLWCLGYLFKFLLKFFKTQVVKTSSLYLPFFFSWCPSIPCPFLWTSCLRSSSPAPFAWRSSPTLSPHHVVTASVWPASRPTGTAGASPASVRCARKTSASAQSFTSITRSRRSQSSSSTWPRAREAPGSPPLPKLRAVSLLASWRKRSEGHLGLESCPEDCWWKWRAGSKGHHPAGICWKPRHLLRLRLLMKPARGGSAPVGSVRRAQPDLRAASTNLAWICSAGVTRCVCAQCVSRVTTMATWWCPPAERWTLRRWASPRC